MKEAGPEEAGAVGERIPKDGGKREWGGIVREWVELLGRAGVWAFLIYWFIFQVSVVAGPSMQPNFTDGDRLLIDKLTYRFFSPSLGDVVVFDAMVKDAYFSDRMVRRDYIKRIMGLPGQRIRVVNGVVFANGRKVEEAWETRADHGWHWGTTEEFRIPPGFYFVMGDNRGNSEDSRGEKLGFIARSQLKGKVRLRFWPLGRWAGF